MIQINGKWYYTTKGLAEKIEVTKGYLCRLARRGQIRHERTPLGYLFPVDTIEQDWENRGEKHGRT
jgi:hypothetical protein